MEATDLELARALLIANKEATLVAVRNDEVIVCTDRGIKPLLAWVREGRDLSGFSVADKIVGKAPALLYAILGPDAVFSPVMSWTGTTPSCPTSRTVPRAGSAPWTPPSPTSGSPMRPWASSLIASPRFAPLPRLPRRCQKETLCCT